MHKNDVAQTTETGERLVAWRRWKELCALNLCAVEQQRVLHHFAGIRLNRYVRTYAKRTNVPSRALEVPEGDAWHLFESHLTIRATREGKRYKEWMFAGTENKECDVSATLDGRAALLMRDVVREYLRREFSPPQAVSTHMPVSSPHGGVQTLEDLLPGTVIPEDEVALREFDRIARIHANEFVFSLSPREKITILAKELGVSLAHPHVEAAAGCKKSVLNETYRKTFTRLAESLSATYSEEDQDAVRDIILRAFCHVGDLVSQWGKKNGSGHQLLSLARYS